MHLWPDLLLLLKKQLFSLPAPIVPVLKKCHPFAPAHLLQAVFYVSPPVHFFALVWTDIQVRLNIRNTEDRHHLIRYMQEIQNAIKDLI